MKRNGSRRNLTSNGRSTGRPPTPADHDPRGANAGLPPVLWTQKEAAKFLSVSPRYVRDSSMPKLLLPGTGPARRPLVRYDPRAVQDWYNLHSADQSEA
jgi:hypothetical protein